MADLYKPISKQEVINSLIVKFGAVETARYFLDDALSDIKTLEVGLSENNPLLAAKVCQSLVDSLTSLRYLLEKKENKSSLEGEMKRENGVVIEIND